MRLYNPRSCTLATGSVEKTKTSEHATTRGAHHLTEHQQQGGINNNLDQSQTINHNDAAAQPERVGAGSSSSPKKFSPRRTRKLRAIWPPPAVSSSYESTGLPDVVPTSTTECESSLIPCHPSTFRGQPVVPKADSWRPKRPKSKSPLKANKSVGVKEQNHHDKETLSTESSAEKDPLLAKPRRGKAQQRTSAFRSPLRLSRLQLRSPSCGSRLLRRIQGGSTKQPLINLVETNKSSSSEEIFSDENQTNGSPRASCSSYDKELPSQLKSSNVQCTRDHTASAFSVQILKRELQLVPKGAKQNRNHHSPQLIKNETNTTTSSDESFVEAVPGYVSSASFHFDLDFVRANERKERRILQNRNQASIKESSVCSKSSSSTLTSNWLDEKYPQSDLYNVSSRDCVEKTTDPFLRPFYSQPWPSCWDSVDDTGYGSVDGCLEQPWLPDPTNVNRQRLSENTRQTEFFDSTLSCDTWPDGDSWIDFSGDPFKATTKHAEVKTPLIIRRTETFPASEERSAWNDKLSKRSNRARSCPSLGGINPCYPFHVMRIYGKNETRVPIERDHTLLGIPTVHSSSSIKQQQTSPLSTKSSRTSGNREEKTKKYQSAIKLPQKYDKMLKMGVPEGAVRNTMVRDGVDTAVLDVKAQSTTISPTSNGIKVSSVPDKKKLTLLDPFRRFRVHWESHTNVRSNTLWDMVQRDLPSTADSIKVDEDEFSKLFQEVKDPATMRIAKKDSGVEYVIDPKRANNGGIVLARIKLSHRKIAEAIDSYEYDSFGADQIQGLLSLLPTVDEEEKLNGRVSESNGEDSLNSDCEKFMVSMMSVERAKEKLEAMLFMKRFPDVINGLKSDSRSLEKACDEVMGSSRLRKILGVLLELGNRVNTAGASPKQKACAIRLNSLARLNQGKAFDRKTTFLQYVASVLRRSWSDAVSLREELPSLRRTEKIDLVQMQDDLAELEAQFSNIRQMAVALGPEDNLDMLQSTQIGRFTLDAWIKIGSVYSEMEAARLSYSEVLNYFGEERATPDETPTDILTVLSSFCDEFDAAVEYAMAQDRRSCRAWNRNSKRGRIKTLIQSRAPPQSWSDITSMIDTIRYKSFSMSSSFDV